MASFNRIDRLRFFEILRPRIGEEVAEDFTDALQDEVADLATKDNLAAQRELLEAYIRNQLQAQFIKLLASAAILLGAAVAIGRIFFSG